MFKPFCSADLSTLTIKDKRALLSELKAAIKNDVLLNKANRVSIKVQKENEKKAKIQAQIKAAADKLAKLQAKLA
jgi:hypothetical protein